MDIKADYTVFAAPYNLIANQLGGDNENAKQKRDVNLRLLLRGPMLQPEIQFDIGFPDLSGPLKGTVDIEVA